MTSWLAMPIALLRLAWQGVRRRAVSSLLTALAVALGVGLVVAVGAIRASAERSFLDASRGYDLILGPERGSPLQTVLATLFHVDEPPGTVPWEAYESVLADPRVRAAVPYAMGDTFRGHRVVATSAALFETLADGDGVVLADGLRGRLFAPGTWQAVVGSEVAGASGLRLGESFRVTHGLAAGGHEHAETLSVVGVLRPTATPHDRAIYVPIGIFHELAGHDAWKAHDGHDEEAHEGAHGEEAHEDGHHEEAHEDDLHGEDGHEEEEAGDARMISAIGVRLHSPALRLTLLDEIRRRGDGVQAILPTDQVRDLLGIVGDVDRGVRVIAWLVTLVAALGVLVGLYNTIQGRRREIAILRALGARPQHVFTVIVLEAMLLCLAGGLLGLLLGHGGVAAAAPTLLAEYGVRVHVGPSAADATILGALLLLGLAAGLLPAWRGLATPVAENLHPQE